eukprot:TRINITY_DN10760_c0_g1_i1.p1 TRINITY_DN10760_c0_g1~~TRINITY_DN10760_c0_g1_i1.p1  ORF type:complete len:903 (-),score=131.03 TRINITY_DN10760_c0_g1_i1:243-2702(-)
MDIPCPTHDSLVALHGAWEDRFKLAQQSFRTLEPLLQLRQVLYGILYHACNYDSEELGDDERSQLRQDRDMIMVWKTSSYIRLAKQARKGGQYHFAASAIALAASAAGNNEKSNLQVQTERAKLLWARGHHQDALNEMQRLAQSHQKRQDKNNNNDNGRALVKSCLTAGHWMGETGQYGAQSIHAMYTRATKISTWEDAHFSLAAHMDRTLLERKEKEEVADRWTATSSSSQSEGGRVFLETTPKGHHKRQQGISPSLVILSYGRSLKNGHSHIFHSMPRMLTIWFDTVKNSSKTSTRQRELEAVNSAMKRHSTALPPYQWLTCFQQLVSHICHQHKTVYSILSNIILNTLKAYPQQAFWALTAISKSSFQVRSSRGQDIMKMAQHKNPAMTDFLSNAQRLCTNLLTICDYPIEDKGTKEIHLGKVCSALKRNMPPNIIVPNQQALTPHLAIGTSSSGRNAGASATSKYNAFPFDEVTIVAMDDTIMVMNSLARPRKVVLIGSDGLKYPFLCKPKDDLRKDARLMESTSLINKLLKRDQTSRRRNLRIRTYAVVPLNEECGLLEWVQNTSALRHLLIPFYGKQTFTNAIKDMFNKDPNNVNAIPRFRKLVAEFEPVFHLWFLNAFTDPTSWFSARLAYARSLAVMSMAGSMLGLGDRHCENILLDSTTGEVVHVDLNCCFWKGLSFHIPEKVPFRLTGNLRAALGLTGHEGVFRTVCEITLRQLRDNRATLLSVLESFLFDPLVEWSGKGKTNRSGSATGEHENRDARRTINTIDRVLRGIGDDEVFVMSVKGQVQTLIESAIDETNLAGMYMGWCSWI